MLRQEQAEFERCGMCRARVALDSNHVTGIFKLVYFLCEPPTRILIVRLVFKIYLSLSLQLCQVMQFTRIQNLLLSLQHECYEVGSSSLIPPF